MMKESGRLYHCLRCHLQVLVCTYCDRGNVYCSSACSSKSRRESRRISSRRYQATFRGKQNHALRQRRYRARLKEIVTHQGSACNASHDSLLPPRQITQIPITQQYGSYCHACGRSVAGWRSGFLRSTETRKSLEKARAQAP